MARAGGWSEQEMLRVLCGYASLDSTEKFKPPPGLVEEIGLRMPNRTMASIEMRLSNFVARDVEMRRLGIKGLTAGGAHVDEIWLKFSNGDGSLNLQKLLAAAATQLDSVR